MNGTVEQKVFNPGEHLLNIGTDQKPRWYLEVKYRLVWLRELAPDAEITTEILTLDLDREVTAEVFEWDDAKRRTVKVTKHGKGLVIFKATVKLPSGAIGTGTKMENAAAFGDWLEKGESGAIGRALASLGYGTQFVGDELDEAGRIVDAPVDAQHKAPQSNGHQPPQQERQQDPNAPASMQQLETVKKLQKLLGMEQTNLEGLPFSDVSSLIAELSKRLNEQKKKAVS
jgi:hypothetical protein